MNLVDTCTVLVLCSLPCSEHVSPKYPGAQLHVLLATQTPVPLAHGGLQTTARVRVIVLHYVHVLAAAEFYIQIM